jgi:O-antigen ligase
MTGFLLIAILVTGPVMLGAARLWIELPLLEAVALLLLVQGIRLMAKPMANEQRRIDAIDLAVALFVLYAVIRWLTSPAEYLSRIEAMEVVAYAGVFFTCRYGMANRRACMVLLYALVVLGVSETAFGYYLVYHGDWFPAGLTDVVQTSWSPRWVGTYDSPNHYGSFLVTAIAAALALGSFSKLPWALRIILLYLGLMMMIGVMYSGSRGSWLALVAAIGGLVTMGIRNGTMRWWVPVTAALVLLVVAGFLFSLVPIVQERLANPFVRLKSGTERRVQSMEETLQATHDHLLFGAGPGTFVLVRPGASSSRAELNRNDYLDCLQEYGLTGLFLVTFFFAAVTLKFLGPLWTDNRWQDRVLVATGFAAWAALLVHSLFDENLRTPANALLFFTLTGLGVGRIKNESERHWSTIPVGSLGRWMGAGVLLFSVIYGWEVTRATLDNREKPETAVRYDFAPGQGDS